MGNVVWPRYKKFKAFLGLLWKELEETLNILISASSLCYFMQIFWAVDFLFSQTGLKLVIFLRELSMWSIWSSFRGYQAQKVNGDLFLFFDPFILHYHIFWPMLTPDSTYIAFTSAIFSVSVRGKMYGRDLGNLRHF